MVGTMRDDSHVSDLLPGYCLGCLDPDEAARVQRHTADCPSCREELAAMDAVAGRVAVSLPGAEPSRDLEDSLMARIAAASPHLSPAPRPTAVARSPAAGGARSFLQSPAWGIAAVVLVLVLGAGNIVQFLRTPAAPRQAGAPGLTTIVLVGVDTGQGAYGTVVLDTEDNGGVLAMRGLPRLDASHQYQLWLVSGTERRSGGVFSVDKDGYGNLLLTIPKDFRGFTRLGISVEPAGGSPAPTGARVATGTI
jgi:anti-sigma-K factor RskA